MVSQLYKPGLTRAGADPVRRGYTVRPRRPIALRYEGQTRDWVLDGAANYRSVSPNEQAVVLSLCTRQGDIASSPTTGSTLHKIEYLGGADLAADIEDRVRTSNPLARLLRDGAVEVTRIDYEVAPNGLKVAVYFKDLQVDKSRILRADASIRS